MTSAGPKQKRLPRRLDDLVGEATPEVWTSPLLRCRNTAEPFRQRRGVEALVKEAVREIPSPLGMATSERADWLRSAMDGTWSDLGGEFVAFRDHLVERIAAIEHDTVVFSHFLQSTQSLGLAMEMIVLSFELSTTRQSPPSM